MNVFDIDENIRLMRMKKININDYRNLKRTIQTLGSRFEINEKKRKVQKKFITSLYEQLEVAEELRPIVLSNLFIYDDREFLNQIDEAKSFGCKKEEFDKYLRINYNIPPGAYRLKLAEMDTYLNHYSMTTLADRVKKTLKDMKKEVERKESSSIDNKNIQIETIKTPRQFHKTVNDKVA